MKKIFILLSLLFAPQAFSHEIYPTNSAQPVTPANSSIKDNKAIITISLENDIFADEDNNYTNGVRLSYLSPEDKIPYWLDKTANLIPIIDTSGNKRYGFEIGQNIFTPDDISLLNPPASDQPYAGWLYASSTLISDNDDTLDTFQLTLGIVGPSSLADETQDAVHRWISYQRPQGWDNQLKDEPGIILSYNRKYRNVFEMSPFGMGFDVTPSAGFNLGNIYTNADVGLMGRFGQDLPSDYGPPLISPSISGSQFFVPNRDFGWYLFGGVGGRAVARNIFLDGSTFQDSASVDKEIFVGEAQMGLALTFGDTRVSYTHVLRTRQFETQQNPDEYGAITVSVRF